MANTDQHRTLQREDSENSFLKQQTENATEPKILFNRDERLYESSIQARKELGDETQQVLFSERQLKEDEEIAVGSSTFEQEAMLLKEEEESKDFQAVDQKARESNFESEVIS